MAEKSLAIFENYKIRRVYDEKTETWYFSVIDVVSALTDSVNPRDYWFKMKIRVKSEDGLELSTICRQFKMKAPDGKMRETDTASVEGLLRIVQSIPSPKAEPFKKWLARVGYERLQDMSDPARSLNRAREYWQKYGRSEKWIQQRMMGQETRNKLTDYWKDHEIKKEEEYAILTNIIHQEWSELSTRQIAEAIDATGMEENKIAGKKGGGIAKKARLDLEEKTGKKVITGENFFPLNLKRALPKK